MNWRRYSCQRWWATSTNVNVSQRTLQCTNNTRSPYTLYAVSVCHTGRTLLFIDAIHISDDKRLLVFSHFTVSNLTLRVNTRPNWNTGRGCPFSQHFKEPMLTAIMFYIIIIIRTRSRQRTVALSVLRDRQPLSRPLVQCHATLVS